MASQDDQTAIGPLVDWLVENGHPQAAALSSFRRFFVTYTLVAYQEFEARPLFRQIGDWLIELNADHEACDLRLEPGPPDSRRGKHIAEKVLDPSAAEHDWAFAMLYPRRPK